MVEEVRERCANVPGCREIDMKNEYESHVMYRFQLAEDYSVTLFRDPGCVEVTGDPQTLAQYEKLQPIIEDVIYKSAKNAGLDITNLEHNHVHIGFATSFMNPDNTVNYSLFRNFLIDLHNHSELATGVWLDEANAKPFSAQKKNKLKKLLGEFDVLTQSRPNAVELKLFCDFMNRYHTSILNESNSYYVAFKAERICAIGLPSAEWTLELRSNVARPNFKTWLKVPRLMEARIEYLKKLNDPVNLLVEPPVRNNYEKVARYYQFVTESGMQWDEYKALMPANLRRINLKNCIDYLR
jgi:hypothetical protein